MNCAPQNYVRFVERLQQHYVTLSDERILLSFGRLDVLRPGEGIRPGRLPHDARGSWLEAGDLRVGFGEYAKRNERSPPF